MTYFNPQQKNWKTVGNLAEFSKYSIGGNATDNQITTHHSADYADTNHACADTVDPWVQSKYNLDKETAYLHYINKKSIMTGFIF